MRASASGTVMAIDLTFDRSILAVPRRPPATGWTKRHLAGRGARRERAGSLSSAAALPVRRTASPKALPHQIADGSGIKVGLLFDGIDPNNPDLIRSNGQHVITDYQDFSGEGPSGPTSGLSLFNAGLIAAQGHQVYDLSKFVNKAHPLPAGCNIKIEGIAPGASLAVLTVAGPNAGCFNSQIIQAIESGAYSTSDEDVADEQP